MQFNKINTQIYTLFGHIIRRIFFYNLLTIVKINGADWDSNRDPSLSALAF